MLVSRSSRPAALGARVEKRGPCSHRSTNAATPSASRRFAQRVIVGLTSGPGSWIDDARVAADEHQRMHQVRPSQGQVKAQPGPHRVADVTTRPARRTQLVGALPQVGPDVCGAPVAGCVDQGEVTAVGQPLGHREPRPVRLGKPVHRHNGASVSHLARRTTRDDPGMTHSADVQASFAATLGRRVGPLRCDRRGGVARFPLDPSDRGVGGRRAPPHARGARRAVGRFLRPRAWAWHSGGRPWW